MLNEVEACIFRDMGNLWITVEQFSSWMWLLLAPQKGNERSIVLRIIDQMISHPKEMSHPGEKSKKYRVEVFYVLRKCLAVEVDSSFFCYYHISDVMNLFNVTSGLLANFQLI